MKKLTTGKSYPEIDGHRKHFVRYPIQVGKKTSLPDHLNYVKPGEWIAVDVLLPSGYSHLIAPHPFKTEKHCQIACDIHNKYHKWTEEEVTEVIVKSMHLKKKAA